MTASATTMLTTSLMGYGRPFLATGDTSRGLKVVDELNVTKNDLLGLTFWGWFSAIFPNMVNYPE